MTSPAILRLVLLLLIVGSGDATVASTVLDPVFSPDHVIIKFRPDTAASLTSTSPAAVRDELLRELDLPGGCELREPVIRKLVRERNGISPATAVDLDTFYYLTLPSGLSAPECVRRLERHAWIDYVELDGFGSGGGIPNDNYFPNQWHHRNPSKPSASIQTPSAWDITQGSTNVVVAVLDTGLTSSSEFTNRLVPGYNFVSGNANTADDHGHGTSIAGVLAANANNSVLVAGVDWRCRVMPVKVLDSSNSGLYSWWAQGVDYAVINGAKVINLSAGGTSSSITLTRAINSAIAQGVIFVTITHNDSGSTIRFPGNLTACITVGATDALDRRSTFSNYGPQLDLCAPGTNIYSVSRKGTLIHRWGTSYAAPQVAGVASLLAAIHPDLTQQTARWLLCMGADDEVGDEKDEPGFDDYYGWGRLNAHNSLVLAQAAVDHVRWSDGVFELSWSSPPNARARLPFQVQFRDRLDDAWGTAIGPAGYTYSTNRTSWRDTNAATVSRFYRLKLKPLP